MRFVIAIILCVVSLKMLGCKLSIGGVEAPINNPIPASEFTDMWGEQWDGRTIENLRRAHHERRNKIEVFRHGRWKLLRFFDRPPLGEEVRVTRRGVHLRFKVSNSGVLKYLP